MVLTIITLRLVGYSRQNKTKQNKTKRKRESESREEEKEKRKGKLALVHHFCSSILSLDLGETT
ncbi:unnamed protein product [Coffea canephora]|uniref:DH200=94 genomic scaffold, scaffold_302 n=1 Tax=Coffea canephora TaxID=49390 RepID=A0A068VE96_COFCA|nr:unnamed protein product [Coffea canephora]